MDIMSALRQVILAIKTWVDENKVQKVNGKGLSSNDYTAEDKEKVNNIANGLLLKNNTLYLSKNGNPIYGGVQLSTGTISGYVQADWEQTDETAIDFIKNKPVIIDAVVQLSNFIPAPSRAEVGQTVVVKTVDENSKPTEWKTVDMQSVPIITPEDNGKFLMAVDGELKFVSILNAKNTTF